MVLKTSYDLYNLSKGLGAKDHSKSIICQKDMLVKTTPKLFYIICQKFMVLRPLINSICPKDMVLETTPKLYYIICQNVMVLKTVLKFNLSKRHGAIKTTRTLLHNLSKRHEPNNLSKKYGAEELT